MTKKSLAARMVRLAYSYWLKVFSVLSGINSSLLLYRMPSTSAWSQVLFCDRSFVQPIGYSIYYQRDENEDYHTGSSSPPRNTRIKSTIIQPIISTLTIRKWVSSIAPKAESISNHILD